MSKKNFKASCFLGKIKGNREKLIKLNEFSGLKH
jgi:hypothetical protein